MGVSVESLLPEHGQAAGEHAKLLSDLLSAHADRMYVLGGDPARRTLCAVLREGATLDDQFQAAMHAGYVRLPSLDCWLPSAHRVRVQIRATHVASGGRWRDDSG